MRVIPTYEELVTLICRLEAGARSSNWDDRDDPDQREAWLACDAILARLGRQPTVGASRDGERPQMLFAATATMKRECVEVEDGGQAKLWSIVLVERELPRLPVDPKWDRHQGMYVKIVGWCDGPDAEHPEFDRLIGHDITVTVSATPVTETT